MRVSHAGCVRLDRTVHMHLVPIRCARERNLSIAGPGFRYKRISGRPKVLNVATEGLNEDP